MLWIIVCILCILGRIQCSCLDDLNVNLGYPLQQYETKDLNVIVFGNFFSNSSGDIEGRMAVGNNVVLGDGYSIGYAINSAGRNATDSKRDYSLIAGSNITWNSGALYPDGTGIPNPSAREDMFVGEVANIPSYLANRRTGGPCQSCLDEVFECLFGYYLSLSDSYLIQATNAQVKLVESALHVITEDTSAPRYYLQVDASDINQADEWISDNVNLSAEFIITITGTEDVYFNGGSFFGDPNKVVFNVPGSRYVFVQAVDLTGALLAPLATLSQSGGDERGLVIVAEVIRFLEARKPNC